MPLIRFLGDLRKAPRHLARRRGEPGPAMPPVLPAPGALQGYSGVAGYELACHGSHHYRLDSLTRLCEIVA